MEAVQESGSVSTALLTKDASRELARKHLRKVQAARGGLKKRVEKKAA